MKQCFIIITTAFLLLVSVRMCGNEIISDQDMGVHSVRPKFAASEMYRQKHRRCASNPFRIDDAREVAEKFSDRPAQQIVRDALQVVNMENEANAAEVTCRVKQKLKEREKEMDAYFQKREKQVAADLVRQQAIGLKNKVIVQKLHAFEQNIREVQEQSDILVNYEGDAMINDASGVIITGHIDDNVYDPSDDAVLDATLVAQTHEDDAMVGDDSSMLMTKDTRDQVRAFISNVEQATIDDKSITLIASNADEIAIEDTTDAITSIDTFGARSSHSGSRASADAVIKQWISNAGLGEVGLQMTWYLLGLEASLVNHLISDHRGYRVESVINERNHMLQHSAVSVVTLYETIVNVASDEAMARVAGNQMSGNVLRNSFLLQDKKSFLYHMRAVLMQYHTKLGGVIRAPLNNIYMDGIFG